MLRKITYLLSAVTTIVVIGNAGVNFSNQPPQGNTGASGQFCTNCHSDFGLNSGGGNVTTSGLPTVAYTAGTQYNFSLIISHATANRNRWGFSIAARNANGQPVGTFSSTNPNAGPNGDELSHNNGAVVQGPQASFTYTNLRWTAPAAPAAGDNQVTFFYAGVAANGNNGSNGDFVYSGSSMITLPVQLSSFTAAVKGTVVNLKWQTASESNSSHFVIEKSADNQRFIEVAKVNAAGNASSTTNYEYEDAKPAYFERSTFYRLVMVDKDGSMRYSNVVNVTIKATKTFVQKLFPNPVKAGGTMQVQMVADRDQQITLQLVSVSGKVVKQVQASAVKGSNVIDIQLGHYTLAGMYSLIVIMDDQTQQIPVLIQY